MRSSFALLFVTFIFPALAHAGATNIELNCVSDSGRTKVQANVPGDFAEHSVAFTIDNATKNWFDTVEQGNDKDHSVVFVKGSARKGNFTFYLADNEGGQANDALFRFTQIPGGQGVKRTENGEKGSIRAKVQGRDPRGNGDALSKEIVVNCSYVYEI